MSPNRDQDRTAKTDRELFVSVAIENAVDRMLDVSSFMQAIAKVMVIAADEDGSTPGIITPVVLAGLGTGVRLVASKLCGYATDLEEAAAQGGAQ